MSEGGIGRDFQEEGPLLVSRASERAKDGAPTCQTRAPSIPHGESKVFSSSLRKANPLEFEKGSLLVPT